MSERLRILSYNIHKGFNARGTEFVLPKIRDALLTVPADIVFLQEVQGKQHPRRIKKLTTQDQPQTIYLAEGYWPHHIYAKNATFQVAHHGNAFLSKFPFLSWANIDVSLTKYASRSLLHAVIEFPGSHHCIHVLCIHLGLFKAERKVQLTALSQRIMDHVPANASIIIAGDFNDWRGHAQHHLERDLGMHEVFKVLQGEHAKTYPGLRPTFKVDRIYFRGLRLIRGQVLDELPWKKLSDHVPLYAEFSLEEVT